MAFTCPAVGLGKSSLKMRALQLLPPLYGVTIIVINTLGLNPLPPTQVLITQYLVTETL